MNYINLTTGLDWLPMPNARFVRIESTAIEKSDWRRVLRDLDADLLLHLALGHECHFYDCGAGREISKTVSVGVPMIVELLRTHWSQNVPALTESAIEMKRKIGYFRRYWKGAEIKLIGHSKATTHDGDRKHWLSLTKEICDV